MTLRAFRLAGAALILCSSGVAASFEGGLPDAVKERDSARVKLLLDRHADVNAARGDGSTALQWAAHWDDTATAAALIRAGAKVNAADDEGSTSLWLACANGSVAMADLLLKAGADPNVALTTGETPAMAAARTGDPEVLRLLVAHGADVNAREKTAGQTALMWAVAENHLDVVKILIDHRADVHARSGGSFTALLFAAQQGNLEAARMLLDAGADVNESAPDGVGGDTNALLMYKPGTEASALMVAIDSAPETEGAQRLRLGDQSGPVDSTLDATHEAHEKLAMYLLDRGANPHLNGAGRTALHSAVQRDMPGLVRALLKHGADPNARITKPLPAVSRLGAPVEIGATAFWLAASYGNVATMRILAEGGTDARLPSNDGTTPLMAAAGINFVEGMDRYGRRWFANGTESLQAAARQAVLLCLDLGNDINAANNRGFTAMFAGVCWNGPSFVQFLYDHGAQVNVKNERGQTPYALVGHAGRISRRLFHDP